MVSCAGNIFYVGFYFMGGLEGEKDVIFSFLFSLLLTCLTSLDTEDRYPLDMAEFGVLHLCFYMGVWVGPKLDTIVGFL